ncbi:unnamed protein product [Ectocarpus sp. 6 AP-2014]
MFPLMRKIVGIEASQEHSGISCSGSSCWILTSELLTPLDTVSGTDVDDLGLTELQDVPWESLAGSICVPSEISGRKLLGNVRMHGKVHLVPTMIVRMANVMNVRQTRAVVIMDVVQRIGRVQLLEFSQNLHRSATGVVTMITAGLPDLETRMAVIWNFGGITLPDVGLLLGLLRLLTLIP